MSANCIFSKAGVRFPGSSRLVPLVAVILGLALGLPGARAALQHRYTFETDANDSVGTAHGTLQGNAYVSEGAVVLDGSADTYVELPGGLVDGYAAVTFEAWASFGPNGNWSRLYDFGDTSPTGNGRYYVMFTPHSGAGDTRVAIADADPGYDNEYVAARAGVLDDLGVLHIAAVYEPARNFMGMYLDGVLVASRTDVPIQLSSISNVLSYLGRSLYAPDAFLNGSILEFRIYDQALTPPQVAASRTAGPDNPNLDPGALQSITLVVEPPTLLLNGFGQCQVLATYAQAVNVDISSLAEVEYRSSNTNKVLFTAPGTVKGAGLGVAIVTVTYQGKQASQAVTVITAPAVLKHRYNFNETADTATAPDSVGGADGVLQGGAQFTGTGKLTLDGADGYVDLPNGIISKLTNATFETWVTWSGPSNVYWQRIFDFGSNASGEDRQGTGTRYLFLSTLGGANRTRFAITTSGGGAGEQSLDGPTVFPLGLETHVVVTYGYAERVAKLYLNGLLAGSRTVSIPLTSITDVNNWLGRSNWPDPFFNGEYNEFRIYDGTLTDTEVALNGAAGPDKLPGTGPGELRKLTLQLTNRFWLGGRANASALADFANQTGVNVTALAATLYTSSDTNVAKVNTNGLVEAIGLGAATIAANFQGRTATVPLTVAAAPGVPAKPILLHRYSFSEAADSTLAKDSIGAADGTLQGNGRFTGAGKLSLLGGAATSAGGYVDLPNGLISGHTNLTFEAWTTWRGPSSSFWQRLFDFGNNDNGEDQQGNGTRYLFLATRGGADRVRFGITVTGGGVGEQIVDGPAIFPLNRATHVALSYNFVAGTARLYLNGLPVASGLISLPLSEIDDVNNWLGRSNWPDAFFNGDLDEFRIYDGAMVDADAAASFAAGPDTLPGDKPPRLEVAWTAGEVVLSWPAEASGFLLEATASLGTDRNWTEVTITPVSQGGLKRVTVAPSGAVQFYRLRKG